MPAHPSHCCQGLRFTILWDGYRSKWPTQHRCKWLCLKIRYIPNKIAMEWGNWSLTIGFRLTTFSDKPTWFWPRKSLVLIPDTFLDLCDRHTDSLCNGIRIPCGALSSKGFRSARLHHHRQVLGKFCPKFGWFGAYGNKQKNYGLYQYAYV